jgi:hypothetical protein
MDIMWLYVAFFLAVQEPPAPLGVAEILSRTAEEAEVLSQNAPKVLTLETLEQRALMPASRFRPRIGKAATEIPKPRLQSREIVSEYSVGTLKESATQDLFELRQVVEVDGHKVQSPASARHALSLGIRSPDDRVRKKMLEDFAKHGLVDIATDYGLILLAFAKRAQENMDFRIAGDEQVGADPAIAVAWRQKSSDAGVLVFAGNQASRRTMQGRLLVRKSDGLPLRIETWTERAANGHVSREEATVDYVQSTHGFLTPASVVHRHLIDGNLITENLYRYEPFKMFGADTEIKFTELPETAPATPPTAPPPTKK